MFKKSEFTKEVYKPKDVMQLLGVTHRTLYNYDEQGKLKFSRSESGRRIIFREDLLEYLNSKGLLYDDTKEEKRDYIYARVSSNKQVISGDLDRQVLFLVESVNNLRNPIVLKEVGSSLNNKRTQLLKLIEEVMNGSVNNVYVTDKDILIRFGYPYLEKVFNHYGVSIIEIKGIEQDIEEDITSLVAKEKLAKIAEYINKTEELKKQELLDIIDNKE